MTIPPSQKFIAVIFLILAQLHFSCAHGHIFPVNGSRLTQVQIMFEFDEVIGADLYDINIYRVFQKNKRVFTEKVFSHQTTNIAFLVNNSLQFGNDYQWQYKAIKKHKTIFTSPVINFSILKSAQVMNDSFRTEISFTGNPGKELIFLDHSAMAIDKKGNPVWYLPVHTDSLSKLVIRDLKLTASGTITHLDIYGAFEKDLQGNLLWRGPDDGRVSGRIKEEYHHQLNKKADGSYVVCGSFYKQEPKESTTAAASTPRFNTLIHYNADGSIRWSWNELYSMKHDSLFKNIQNKNMGGHLNGFAFTNDDKQIFMSFKNISDVYLYDIKSEKFVSSIKQFNFTEQSNFLQQHGPYFTNHNELIIYNNNIIDTEEGTNTLPRHPSVMFFRYDTLTRHFSLAWKYEVHSKKFPEGISGKEGYVSETKNGNILICPGGANYAEEVTRKKEKIWDCYFYKRIKGDSSWKPYSNYRCQSASSLYPLYFTLQFAGNKKDKSSFRLYNAGSEPGIFELVFYDSLSKITTHQVSRQLKAGESQIITIHTGIKKSSVLHCRIMPRHLSVIFKDYYFLNIP